MKDDAGVPPRDPPFDTGLDAVVAVAIEVPHLEVEPPTSVAKVPPLLEHADRPRPTVEAWIVAQVQFDGSTRSSEGQCLARRQRSDLVPSCDDQSPPPRFRSASTIQNIDRRARLP